jgi:hypothetical protein
MKKVKKLLTYGVMLDSLIVAYVQYVIMLIDLQSDNQHLKCLCIKSATVLMEQTVPKTMNESLLHFYCVRNKYIV